MVYDPDNRDKFKDQIKAELVKTNIGFNAQSGTLNLDRDRPRMSG